MPQAKSIKAPVQAARKSQKPQVSAPAPAKKDNANTSSPEHQLPTGVQQALLDIFRNACVNDSISQFETTLQEVKGHLYNRDFAAAFGKDEYLQAYAARWSPSRALGYAELFCSVQPYIFSELGRSGRNLDCLAIGETASIQEDTDRFIAANQDVSALTAEADDSGVEGNPNSADSHSSGADYHENGSRTKLSSPTLRIACLGGGAGAEVVGLAGWLKTLGDDCIRGHDTVQPTSLNILGIDIAAWGRVLDDLAHHIVTPPPLSKYASAAAKAANSRLLPPTAIRSQFRQLDVLVMDAKEVHEALADMDLITIMFTLNELYTTSVPKTQRLLHQLTESSREGTFLLVVDSPGSYSAVTINGSEKKYPMQWLLDHTLLEEDRESRAVRWEKLVSDASRWFRLPGGLKYPIDLENMRYQVHLYRRCDTRS